MFDWPAALFSPPAPRSAREGFRFSPSLECLNDRVVPAVVTVPELDHGAAPAGDVATASVWLDQLREVAEKAPDTALTHLVATDVTTPAAAPRVGGEASEQLVAVNGASGVSVASGPLADDVADRIVEAFRSAPAGEKWDAVRRVWLETRPAIFDVLWRPLVAPQLPVQPVANVAEHSHAPPAAVSPVHPQTPVPAADPSVGAGNAPKSHSDWWVINVSGDPAPALGQPEPSAPVRPLSPAQVPDEPQQPAPRSDREPVGVEFPDAFDGAGVVTRFLPFDTAGLRDGVSDFLCGLEPAISAVPNQLFGGWELGAALVTGAGAALTVGKRRTNRRKHTVQTAAPSAREPGADPSDVSVAWPVAVNE